MKTIDATLRNVTAAEGWALIAAARHLIQYPVTTEKIMSARQLLRAGLKILKAVKSLEEANHA